MLSFQPSIQTQDTDYTKISPQIDYNLMQIWQFSKIIINTQNEHF